MRMRTKEERKLWKYLRTITRNRTLVKKGSRTFLLTHHNSLIIVCTVYISKSKLHWHIGQERKQLTIYCNNKGWWVLSNLLTLAGGDGLVVFNLLMLSYGGVVVIFNLLTLSIIGEVVHPQSQNTSYRGGYFLQGSNFILNLTNFWLSERWVGR